MSVELPRRTLPLSSSETQATDLRILQMEAEFSAIVREIVLERNFSTLSTHEQSDGVAEEAATEEALAPHYDRCQQLAWAIALLQAGSPTALLAKSRVLLDRMDSDPHDVSSVLMLSICRDICSIFGPSNRRLPSNNDAADALAAPA
ncbi:MAG: hypothetical protein ACKVP7_04330 [Hyphomicrobiaceae bacterium]